MVFAKNNKISIKSDREIEIMKEGGKILRKVLDEMKDFAKEGISTKECDLFAEKIIIENGAKPAFKGYSGFPGTICASINDEVVHTFPSEKKILKSGDLFKVDCGVNYKGFFTDSCVTIAIGEVSKEKGKLKETTKKSLDLAIQACKDGVRVGDISSIIQSTVESQGFSPVRECVGHGIGRNLHEAPQVPNFGVKGTGVILKENMTICIEPIINMGSYEVFTCKDNWCIKSKDGLPSAHFEHTIRIGKDCGEILT